MSSRWLFLVSTVLIALLALFTLWHGLTPKPVEAGGEIHYVAPNGLCNGVTPCYSNLQTAVSSASPNDEIRIAQGIYSQVQTRTWGSEIITQVALIDKPLTIHGGYSTINWDVPSITQTTVLSANYQGRVLAILGEITDTWQVNISHLVIAQGQTFTNTSLNWGGGIWVNDAHLELTHSEIISNISAGPGGGLAMQNGMLTLTDNLIAGNQAGDSVFSGGGGVQLVLGVDHASLIDNNQFINNHATGQGGAIGITDDAQVTITHNTLSQNSAEIGGAIFAYTVDELHIHENSIEYNNAYEGGGIGFITVYTSSLEQNIIRFNQVITPSFANSFVQGRGGGLSLQGVQSPLPMINNVIADNQADADGGAMYIDAVLNLQSIHNTIARNLAPSGIAVSGDFGGACATPCYTLALTNTILVSHSVGITMMDDVATLFTNHTLWHQTPITIGQATTATTITSLQNVVGDPLFLADGYHISVASSALNAGTTTSVTIDIDEEQRPLAAPADIGADETLAYLHYVAPSGNCGDVSPCYDSIQTAVDSALAGDEIRVANGTYDQLDNRFAQPNTTLVVTQVVYISKSLTIQGGYSNTNWMTPDPTTNLTIIDGQQTGRGIYIYGEPTVYLNGLQITNGFISTTSNLNIGTDGAGIYGAGATLTLEQIDINNNHAPLGKGGGLASWGALTLTDSTLTYNQAITGGGLSLSPLVTKTVLIQNNVLAYNMAQSGGGLAVHSGGMALTVQNNHIHDNEAEAGGGLWGHSATGLSLQQNQIEANIAYWGGGLTFVSSPSPLLIEQNYILNNQAVYTSSMPLSGDGGGIALRDANPRLVNNIVAENVAEAGGAALSILGSAYPQLIHTTLANNSGFAGIQMGECDTVCAGIGMTNTLISKHPIGIYVMDGVNEVYINAHLWGQVPITVTAHPSATADIVYMERVVTAVPYLATDYRLTALSPAIDMGIPIFGNFVDVDIEGDERPFFAGFDLGADEFTEGVPLPYALFLPIVRAPFD